MKKRGNEHSFRNEVEIQINNDWLKLLIKSDTH